MVHRHLFAVVSIMFTILYQASMIQIPTAGRARVCSRHIPLPIDKYLDLARCKSEVKAARRFKDPNARKRTAQIVLEQGYNLKTYTVTSKDGYIRTVYRVRGRRKSGGERKPSVLLQHAFASSSDSWFILPPNKNIVFKLADAGYDVWVPNGRGTYRSRGHVNLNWKLDIEYWDFSFHEMGLYDLPATVDLILEVSENEKLFYIGYSQGAAMLLVATSEIPEMNEKFHAAFLLAPAAYLGRAYMEPYTSLLPILYTPTETLLFSSQGGHLNFRKPEKFMASLGIQPIDICSVAALQCDMCHSGFYAILDFNPYQANFTNTANVLRMLDTANLKTAYHFGQNILSCEFRKYDYGPAENLQRYGSVEPPPYRLENVRVPLHLFYGEQDSFATPPDVHRLARDIDPKTLQGVHRVNDDTFNHGDFVAGRDADTLVYDWIIDLMSE